VKRLAKIPALSQIRAMVNREHMHPPTTTDFPVVVVVNIVDGLTGAMCYDEVSIEGPARA
jgi:hypothetical protein